MSKGITYAAMLALGEDELADTFPYGAMAEGNRYWPAQEGEEPKLTRDDLLKRRRGLQERVNLMPTDSTRPAIRAYVQTASLKGVLGAETHTTEDALGEEQEPEPEMVDPETLNRFSEEARSKRAVTNAEEERRAEMRSYLGRLRQLGIEQIRAGQDPAPVFRSALEQLEERRKAA